MCSKLKYGVLETLSKITEELELLINIVKIGEARGKTRSETLPLILQLWDEQGKHAIKQKWKNA